MRFLLPLSVIATMVFVACGSDDPVAPIPKPNPIAPLSFDTFQAADVVIGQLDMASGSSNAGGTTSAVGLSSPFGEPASGSLYVPDQGNKRVLGFNTIPTTNGEAADFVLGQADFTSNAPGLSASAFANPLGCVVAGGKLFLVENGSRRVLIWNSLPTSSNVPADVVVGQADFTSSATGTFTTPINVAVAGGKLFVLDFALHRCLIWNSIPTTNGVAPDVVVGQPDFVTTTPGLSATSFGNARGLWTDGTRLAIAESMNRRVLIWNSIPTTNGEPADVVVGAFDFTTESSPTPSATSIGNARAVTSDGTSLFVSDAGFHRVLIYPFPAANGAAATRVLGQTNFTLSAANDPNQDDVSEGVISARTFGTSTSFSPGCLRVIGRQLFVGDQSNNRILIFNSK